MSIEDTIRVVVRAVIREELGRAATELLVELRDAGTPRLLDREGAARLLDISTKTLDRLVKAGAPFLLVGDAKRFEPTVLVGWLKGRKGPGLRSVPRPAFHAVRDGLLTPPPPASAPSRGGKP